MRFHPQITHGDQALAFEPVIGQSCLGCQGPGQMPVAFAAHGGQDGLALARSQGQEVADLGAHVTTYFPVGRPSGQPTAVQNRSRRFCAPLFPVTHADAPPQPLIQFGDRAVVVVDTEVSHPPSDVLGDFPEPVIHRDPPAAAGQAAKLIAEILEGAIRPTQLGSPKGKAEKLTLVDLHDPAFGLVDL